MRTVIALLVMAVLIGGGVPVFAETVPVKLGTYVTPLKVTVHDAIKVPKPDHNTSGVKVDAPNLIRFTENLTLGMEASKDIYKNAFYSEGYFEEGDRGYSVYAKVTYTGSLFDFSKK